MKLAFDLNLEYVPEYFDTTIDNLLSKQEELDAVENKYWGNILVPA